MKAISPSSFFLLVGCCGVFCLVVGCGFCLVLFVLSPSFLSLIKGICSQYQIGDGDLLIASLYFSVLSLLSFLSKTAHRLLQK